MRQRNFLLLLLLAIFMGLFTSCTKDSEGEPAPPGQWITFQEGTSYSANGTGETLTVKFTTTESWSLSVQEEWMEVAPASGNSGENTIEVAVESNATRAVRSGVIRFASKQSSATAEITVNQQPSGQGGQTAESGYLDLKLDDASVRLAYEESSSTVTVTYSDGNVPAIQDGKAIVLPGQYDYDVRVIEKHEVNGNQVSLKTRQGNMCDLFQNTEFTLTTNPDLAPASRVGRGGTIITPSQVTLVSGDSRHVIYDEKMAGARADVNVVNNLYTFSQDYKGNVLYEKDGSKLYWDKCAFDLGLNSVFYFNFSEEVKDEIKKGDLKEFSFYLDGKVSADFLMKYLGERELAEEMDGIVLKEVTPTLELKFLVGNVPVFISLDTNLGAGYVMEARSELRASAGLKFQSAARLGMSWSEERGMEPIKDFAYEYQEYDPTFSAEGSLSAQVAYYPQVEISIYKFIGPWVDIIPYLQQDVKAGMQVTGSGNNYLGWEHTVSAGVSTRMGLNFDFFFFDVSAYKTEVMELASTNIYEAPYNLLLVSPHNDLFSKNEEIEATFKVTALCGTEEVPCPGAFVTFVGDGSLSNRYALSDQNGLVTVRWTPDGQAASRGIYPITAVPHWLYVRVIGSDGSIIQEYPWKVMVD